MSEWTREREGRLREQIITRSGTSTVDLELARDALHELDSVRNEFAEAREALRRVLDVVSSSRRDRLDELGWLARAVLEGKKDPQRFVLATSTALPGSPTSIELARPTPFVLDFAETRVITYMTLNVEVRQARTVEVSIQQTAYEAAIRFRSLPYPNVTIPVPPRREDLWDREDLDGGRP